MSNVTDRIILCCGCLLNLLLQLALVFTVAFDMLDSPFTIGTVEEMLRWRVQNAHPSSAFDGASGESLLRRLCNQELWSFEQEEFKLMYAYLYMPVPGSGESIFMFVQSLYVFVFPPCDTCQAPSHQAI